MTKTGDAARPTLDLSDSESAGEFFQRHQRTLIIAAVVVAAAGGGLWMAKRSAAIKEARAAEALVQAEGAYQSGGQDAGQVELKKVLARYAGTVAGTQAALLSAQTSFEAGQADSGLAAISVALAKAPGPMRAGLLSLQATGKALKGDHAAAAKDFEAAVAASELTSEKDSYRMEAARSYVAAGDTAAAVRLYEEIAAREDSDYASEAKLRLGEIRAKA